MSSSDPSAAAASAAAAAAPAPAALSPEEKSLKVKVNVVLRLEKELLRYGEEATAQAAVVAGMRARDADEHDVRKQAEVLAEAEMMVPDTARRLQKAVEDQDAHMVRALRGRRRARSAVQPPARRRRCGRRSGRRSARMLTPAPPSRPARLRRLRRRPTARR